MNELREVIEKINLRFKSGNDIPVRRTHINLEEWEILKQQLTSERQAKTELINAIELSRESIRRYANFTLSFMDEEDKQRVIKFDDKLTELIKKHTGKKIEEIME